MNINMFDFLKLKFKDYVKNNFNEIVYSAIANNNDILLEDYRKSTLRTISYFESEIDRLKKMSRIEIEEEQLNQNMIATKNHYAMKHQREKNSFDEELCKLMLRDFEFGDYGSALYQAVSLAKETAHEMVNIPQCEEDNRISISNIKVLDYQDYRQKRINYNKERIQAHNTLLSAYESQIVYLRNDYAQLEEKSKNCIIHKYEVLCYNDDGIHVNEYDIDSIKFKIFDEAPDDLDYETAYNIVYDVTQMYEGVPAEPKEIEDCLIKYDSSLKYQEIEICDGFKLAITELKG